MEVLSRSGLWAANFRKLSEAVGGRRVGLWCRPEAGGEAAGGLWQVARAISRWQWGESQGLAPISTFGGDRRAIYWSLEHKMAAG